MQTILSDCEATFNERVIANIVSEECQKCVNMTSSSVSDVDVDAVQVNDL